ncbi:MAG: ATPase [Hyphomicrobiales bacterium]|nr:MAG: ATPase [Hyphomicrobiales bacterium]
MNDQLKEERKAIGSATASPTKNFFVNMLTRDIELPDAILDLLDNCVDGILRTAPRIEGEAPYAGFNASLTMDVDHFVIEDNCGGIPKSIGEHYAFSMGRPPGEEVAHLQGAATVGMYGIGMKRAIFKLGTEAHVESWNDEAFIVEFSPEWMADRDWTNLPMYPLNEGALADRGTRITVYELNEECKRAFGDPAWIDEFRKTVARHYSIIIGKGFEVRIGSAAEITAKIQPIKAAEFKLLETDALDDGSRIQPYVYVGVLHGVEIEIYAGLYRKLLTAEEADREEQTRGAKDDAGWTVACNDRVVIWKDTTRLTGWGEGTVPNFHGQFIAITGVVLMRSDDPKKLPLTTTKRGIDAASSVYSEVKDLMKEATKSLTTFTNRWKKNEKQLEDIYRNSRYIDLPQMRSEAYKVATATVRKFSDVRKSDVRLPNPKNETTTASVNFTANKADIAFLAKHFFEDETVRAGLVGEAAFAECVGRYRR